jgi:Spy/CpxP family protein refolding chaperone
MDKAMLLDHLEKARRHVAEGELHLAHQRELVAKLGRDGHDTKDARQLLEQFEELQQLHIQDRDRLERELAEISN